MQFVVANYYCLKLHIAAYLAAIVDFTICTELLIISVIAIINRETFVKSLIESELVVTNNNDKFLLELLSGAAIFFIILIAIVILILLLGLATDIFLLIGTAKVSNTIFYEQS